MTLKPLVASIVLAIAAMNGAHADTQARDTDAVKAYRVFSCVEDRLWSADAGPCVEPEKKAVKSAPIVTATPVPVAVKAPAPVVKAAPVSTDLYSVMYLPTGIRETSALMIERTAPNQVVAGQPFDYNIKATNLTPAPLSNVAVQDMCSTNFKLLQSTPEVERIGESRLRWNLGDLKANESRTININGQIADANKAKTCLSANYDQASCLAFNVVQPQLTLKAAAPAEIMRCDAIPLTYTVANPGTGAARNAAFVQALPEGVSVKDGSAKMAIGDLAPGASKDLQLAVMAAKPGVYEFRPTASADPSLKAEAAATTRVTQPMLQVEKKMADSILLGRDVDYGITVTNTGDAVARKLVVEEAVPAGAKINSVSDNGRVEAGRIVWNLADLAPKQSQSVKVSLHPAAVGSVEASTRASAYCADAAAAQGKTAVIGIPAVLLEVVDLTDPVEVGKETVYVITATNQGTATDINVHIVAELEDSFLLSSTAGATDATVNGLRIDFAPLPKLEAGAKAEWKVTAKAVAPADARFTVIMTSDLRKRPVMETEATTLYK